SSVLRAMGGVAGIVEDDVMVAATEAAFERCSAGKRAAEQRRPIAGANRDACERGSRRDSGRRKPLPQLVERNEKAKRCEIAEPLSQRGAFGVAKAELALNHDGVLVDRAATVAGGQHRVLVGGQLRRRAVLNIAHTASPCRQWKRGQGWRKPSRRPM